MVQRLTYRRRHSYATKSNQHRVVKTPGNLSSLHFVRVSVYNNGECNFCFCLIGVVKFMQVVSLFIRQLRRELVDQNALLLEREFKEYVFCFWFFFLIWKSWLIKLFILIIVIASNFIRCWLLSVKFAVWHCLVLICVDKKYFLF
jgi:hypothetical protein